MKFGCSSFTWETADGKHLLGRTYDQAGDLSGNRIVLAPAGFCMQMVPGSEETAVTSYSMAGMAVLGLSTPIFVDGVNEKGLMGALLNYPGYAVYEDIPERNGKKVHPGFLVGYLLGRAGSVAEAARELETLQFADELVFGEHMDIHYIFSDRTGEAIVVEPESGGIRVHRDTIGVMTNSPDYLWHKTNLRNYRGTLEASRERPFLNTRLSGFGGSFGGGFGLPGDYSSPSRFVRLAVLKEVSVKGRDEIDGVTRMFQTFSSVTIPEGILWEENERGEKEYEMTLCTSVMCAESCTYYFSVRENRRICAVKLTGKEKGTKLWYCGLPETQDVEDRSGNAGNLEHGTA